MYPKYSRTERIADGFVHATGVGLALIFSVILLAYAPVELTLGHKLAVLVYNFTLVGMLFASGIYHMTPWESLRPLLRRIDHAVIFVKIAGTFTPLVVLINTPFAYGILALVWALALSGAVKDLFFWRRPGRFGPFLYLGLAWIGVALIWPIFEISPRVGGFMVAGGLTYTVGVVFYKWDGLRYSRAIWHSFVLIASGFFFAAVASSLPIAA